MRKPRVFRSIKAKLTATLLLCFILIVFPSFIAIYYYMNNLVFEQVARVNQSWVQNAVDRINGNLEDVVEAVSWICFNPNVQETMRHSPPILGSDVMSIRTAQESISAFMAGSSVWDNLNKVVVFNDKGMSFIYTKGRFGNLDDVDLICLKNEYSNIVYRPGSYVKLLFGETLNEPREKALIAYGRIDNSDSYVYVEMNMGIFDPLFKDIAVDNVFIKYGDNKFYPNAPENSLFNGKFRSYEYDLTLAGASVVGFDNKKPLGIDSFYGISAFVSFVAGCALLYAIISFTVSRYLTESTNKLVRHIEMLTQENAFGQVDKSIEDGDDEVARIGRSVNAMSLSIRELLDRNEKLFEEKKNAELSMLQMQVNPHFLYNTLESIHYLAVVQKADGIASMSRGLSHLLKNIAKCNGERIPLSDELKLLNEYDEIQQVRYMGMYEMVFDIDDEFLDCLIQKFTLQPLVENAIFHGIEPSGRFGTIKISAKREGQYLIIYVEDDGIGMSNDTLEHIFDEQTRYKNNLTGVGVKNINERIKLYYGDDCGLFFSSEEGKGCTAWVKILFLKERKDV